MVHVHFVYDPYTRPIDSIGVSGHPLLEFLGNALTTDISQQLNHTQNSNTQIISQIPQIITILIKIPILY